MTGFEIIGALSGIIAILATMKSTDDRENELETSALKALSDAVTSTEKYLSLENKRSASVDANYELTNAWHKASLLFRDAGYSDMQKLCQIKGNYWLDPNAWTDEQVEKSGIKLKEMRERLNPALSS